MGADGFVHVDRERCDLCAGCVAVCAPLALRVVGASLSYDPASCTVCGDCFGSCPREALSSAP